MSMILPAFLRRLIARIKYRNFERDLAQEIETHRSLAEAAFASGSDDAGDARYRAARALGNTTIAREDSRATWIPLYLQQFQQDARYALRGLRRQPGFSAAVVLMLMIGLGLFAGGYSVVNGFFLRGWNVPESSRVFRVGAERRAAPAAGTVYDGFSFGAFKYLLANAKAGDYIAMSIETFRIKPENTEGRGTHTQGMLMSSNAIETLRIPLQRGQGFAGVHRPGETPRILISDAVWRRVFASDPNIIGRTVRARDVAATIVGVTAREFDGLGERPLDVVAELEAAPQFDAGVADEIKDETRCCVTLVGRIREGFSRQQVREELELLTTQYRRALRLPDLVVSLGSTAPGESLGRTKSNGLVMALTLVGSGILLVLLLTCANVGNLYLARSLRRQREIAVRLSLGASRARVVRQLLTEGLVMAAIAGAGAFAITTSVPILLHMIEDNVSMSMFAADWRVALFTVTGVFATCLLVSLAPALQTTRIQWRGATASISARTGQMRGVVLAVQIAIATVLVLSAALIARGILQAASAPDFALHSTIAVTLQVPADVREDSKARDRIGERLASAVKTSDLEIGLAGTIPASGRAGLSTGVNVPQSEVEFRTRLVPISTAALKVLDVPLTRGRWASDDAKAGEAVINETLARQIWPDGEAVGRRLTLHFNKKDYVIVGVTRDAHLTALDDVEPMIHATATSGLPHLLVRDAPDLARRVKALVASVDPSLTITLTPLSDSVRQTLMTAMGAAAIASALGAIALILAIIGVFGVFSYLVEERRREIGIRLALGASRRQVRGALMRAVRSPVIMGLVAGLTLSAIAGMALRSLLFGLSPADPISYGLVAVVLTAAALIATAIPLRRALRIDPAATLKAD